MQKYIFHGDACAHWEAATRPGDASARLPAVEAAARMYGLLVACTVVEAGQALLVDDTFELDDTFSLTPTPGHSPCRCCVNIRSRGQHAVVTGDMMHHALQCREPDWSTVFDSDRKQAAQSRRRFLGQVADTSTLILPIHFPNPTVGRVAADGERFRYTFVS